MYVKAYIVNVNKRLKPFFLDQYTNIVNRVTLQSFWFIFRSVIMAFPGPKVIKPFHAQIDSNLYHAIIISMTNTTSESLKASSLYFSAF